MFLTDAISFFLVNRGSFEKSLNKRAIETRVLKTWCEKLQKHTYLKIIIVWISSELRENNSSAEDGIQVEIGMAEATYSVGLC
jgi:hypothetical protein